MAIVGWSPYRYLPALPSRSAQEWCGENQAGRRGRPCVVWCSVVGWWVWWALYRYLKGGDAKSLTLLFDSNFFLFVRMDGGWWVRPN